MLKQRIITALILAPLAILAIFYLPIAYFSGLLMAIVAVGAWEWSSFMGLKQPVYRLLYSATTLIIISLFWLLTPAVGTWNLNSDISFEISALLWLSSLWWVTAILLIFSYPKLNKLDRKSVV